MPDCRNDCSAPLAFPKTVDNRPGLPRIAYRIGTYSDFRAALFRKLDQDPVLAPWSYRGADDPGIALLEAGSILGDILTFYQEAYANELYLLTATLPVSIAELVRQVGYRLSPGVGGRGVFAFEVTGARPVVIPAGFPVTADVTGADEPAAFETAAELVARPALSKFALCRPFTVPAVAAGTKIFAADTAQLASAGIVLEKGNRLMLANSSTSPSYHQIAVVDKVETHFEQTEITVKGAWLGGAASSLSAFKLGRDFRHFGYNAPPKETVLVGGAAQQQDVDFTRYVGPDLFLGFVPVVLGGGFVYSPVATAADLPLDSQVGDLGPGATLLVTAEVVPFTFFTTAPSYFVFALRQVVSVQNASLTRGSLTGPSTVVRLDQLIASGAGDWADIRGIQIHEVTGGPFTVTGARSATSGTALGQLYFFGNGEDYQALGGRALQFQRNKPAPGQKAAFEQTTVSITASAVGSLATATLRPVTLSPALQDFTIDEFPLSFPPDKQPVLVYGNLAEATQGKTEKPAVLGNGDARVTFQTFAIPKAPLTYLVSTSATPPEVPELVVTVDEIEWKQVPSLIGYGPKDQVYIVREDSAGQSYVQFGDGETGARTTSGIANVAVTYRTGVAAFGPLKPGASADAGARLSGLDGVALLDQVTGGDKPEDPEKARSAAPGKIQSLGRLVSLRDFETETLGIPGVSAASAAWEIVDGVPAVAVTVLMETGRAAELSAVTQLLASYNVCRGPQRYPIVVRAGRRSYLYVDIAVALAPGYLEQNVFPALAQALGALFSVPTRAFGQREYRSRIEGVAQNAPGVAWNSVTGLGSLGPADDPKTLVLPPAPRALAATVSCPGDTILALDPAHLTLSAVAAPVKVC